MLTDVGIATLRQVAALTISLAGVSLFLVLLAPNMLARWNYRSNPRLAQSELAQENRLTRIRTQRIATVLGLGLALSLLLRFLMEYNWYLSIALGTLIVNLIAPLIYQAADKKRQKHGRAEALAIAYYVAGRLNARATLFDALEDCLQEHNTGRRSLPLSAAGIEAVIQSVQLNQNFSEQLDLLGKQFADIPELSGLWKSLAVMQRASLGAEANIEQSDDLATSLRHMDALKDSMETELATSTMTRMAMFMLMGGFTFFLIFFYGDSIGNVLTDTLAGNILLGVSLFTLYLAQLVGNHIERMPLMRF